MRLILPLSISLFKYSGGARGGRPPRYGATRQLTARREPAQAGTGGHDHGRPLERQSERPGADELGGIIADLPAVRAAKKANTLSRVHRRLIEPIETEQDNEQRLAFQHTVFCQTGLPYRNPGDDVRVWQRRARRGIAAQSRPETLRHPATPKMVDLGLPWGTKPRLILAHLNAEALRQDSPVIEVESSLSAFVKRIRGFQQRAGNPRVQRPAFPVVGRPRPARYVTRRAGAFQINSQVVTAFELWPEKDERQRVLVALDHPAFA